MPTLSRFELTPRTKLITKPGIPTFSHPIFVEGSYCHDMEAKLSHKQTSDYTGRPFFMSPMLKRALASGLLSRRSDFSNVHREFDGHEQNGGDEGNMSRVDRMSG